MGSGDVTNRAAGSHHAFKASAVVCGDAGVFTEGSLSDDRLPDGAKGFGVIQLDTYSDDDYGLLVVDREGNVEAIPNQPKAKAELLRDRCGAGSLIVAQNTVVYSGDLDRTMSEHGDLELAGGTNYLFGLGAYSGTLREAWEEAKRGELEEFGYALNPDGTIRDAKSIYEEQVGERTREKVVGSGDDLLLGTGTGILVGIGIGALTGGTGLLIAGIALVGGYGLHVQDEKQEHELRLADDWGYVRALAASGQVEESNESFILGLAEHVEGSSAIWSNVAITGATMLILAGLGYGVSRGRLVTRGATSEYYLPSTTEVFDPVTGRFTSQPARFGGDVVVTAESTSAVPGASTEIVGILWRSLVDPMTDTALGARLWRIVGPQLARARVSSGAPSGGGASGTSGAPVEPSAPIFGGGGSGPEVMVAVRAPVVLAPEPVPAGGGGVQVAPSPVTTSAVSAAPVPAPSGSSGPVGLLGDPLVVLPAVLPDTDLLAATVEPDPSSPLGYSYVLHDPEIDPLDIVPEMGDPLSGRGEISEEELAELARQLIRTYNWDASSFQRLLGNLASGLRALGFEVSVSGAVAGVAVIDEHEDNGSGRRIRGNRGAKFSNEDIRKLAVKIAAVLPGRVDIEGLILELTKFFKQTGYYFAEKKGVSELPSALSQERIDELRAEIRRAEIVYVLLDFDGTASNIAPTPESAMLDPRIREIIENNRTATIVFGFVSGRNISDLEEKLAGLSVPILIGSHGRRIKIFGDERSTGYDVEEYDDVLEEIKAGLEIGLAEFNGVSIEIKSSGIAIHYRGVPEDQKDAVKSRITTILGPYVSAEKIDTITGREVIEVLPPIDVSKGSAVAEIADSTAQMDRVIIYIGDDSTDESAFEVLDGQGLHGIKVVSDETEDTTFAEAVVSSVDQVAVFLGSLFR